MASTKKYFIILLFLPCISFVMPDHGFAQPEINDGLRFAIYRTSPSFTISKDELLNAQNIVDLNKQYKSSWVREFYSVEIKTIHKGKTKSAIAKNDVLTPEQKGNMKAIDVGTDIVVKVKYLPENNLQYNDAKEINFTFKVDPESEATFPGGDNQFDKYMKEKAIDKISDPNMNNKYLAAINFSINESGQIVDALIFESSKNKNIDKILLETICNMPNWKPAEYSNGVKEKQNFVLAVGNMESCVINLLDIIKK